MMSEIVFLDLKKPNLYTKIVQIWYLEYGGHFELWRPYCINKYSLVDEM